MRTEFNYQRTECACEDCTINCRYIPGYLVPADLERMRAAIAPQLTLEAFADQYLLASPGAKILRMPQMKVLQIPTLVPARKLDGSCVFLTEDNRCQIHAVAPYGCAFFDAHQSINESDRRSLRGLEEISSGSSDEVVDYMLTWAHLVQINKWAPGPQKSRAVMDEAIAAAVMDEAIAAMDEAKKKEKNMQLADTRRNSTKYEAYRRHFEHQIKCPFCGNDDWGQFLYVSAGDLTDECGVIAGCKRCTQAHTELLTKKNKEATWQS